MPASTAASRSLGAWPQLNPRPDYRPLWNEVVEYAVTEVFRIPLLCVAVALLTQPLYEAAHRTLPWREWWGGLVAASPVPPPSWVTSEDLFFTLALSTSLGAIYILYNGVFLALDTFGLCARYKAPRKPAQEPSPQLIRHALLLQALAHFVLGPLLMLTVVGPVHRHRNPRAADPAAVPGAFDLWRTFTFAYVLLEVLFYAVHRALHTKALYRFHKQHHQFVGTRSFASEHASPVESLAANYVPFSAGVVLCGGHFHVTCAWFFVRMTEVYESHSGYCFRGSLFDKLWLSAGVNPACHDFHHTGNRGNFGNPLLDFLFGTMDAWVAIGGVEGYLGQRRDKSKSKAA